MVIFQHLHPYIQVIIHHGNIIDVFYIICSDNVSIIIYIYGITSVTSMLPDPCVSLDNIFAFIVCYVVGSEKSTILPDQAQR